MTHNETGVDVRKGANGDRFEAVVDGQVAGFTAYVDTDGKRIFPHTEVDEKFAGQGIAAILVREALDATRSDGLRIVAVCPYVAKFVAKHADTYANIVDPATPELLKKLQ